ncbi:hypothetical protein LLG46_05945 [bacterium]|nr:hypothetical protein [bacterium]
MPELPDVEMLREYIESTSLHQKIVDVNVERTRLLRVDEPTIKRALNGCSFERCNRHGKLVFLVTDCEPVLVMHFGMTGNVQYLRNEEDEPGYSRMRICFANGSRLSYTSIRKLGRIDLTDDVDVYIIKNRLGPDALAIDKERFKTIIRASAASIKSVLMDQGKIAGVGNIYSDEMLFQAVVHPMTRANELDDMTLDRLFHKMKHVLRIAIDHGADSRAFPGSWIVHRRTEGANCPKCGSKIEKLKISGRTSYYCSGCQIPT